METSSSQSERLAVTEERVKAINERGEKMLSQMERIANALDNNSKSHTELAFQVEKLGSKFSGMESTIKSMQPHVETVADWKAFWKVVGIISVAAGSIAGAVTIMWSYIKPYIFFKQ